MYHLYHTDGFVLGGRPFGEGNTFFTLFTKELGMLQASATSVREERSKLRYGVQDFSLSNLTLVRGKEVWRLANATLRLNISVLFRERPEIVYMFGRIFRLLRRLLPEAEKHEELFAALTDTVLFLQTDAEHTPLETIEIVLVLRAPYFLGYVSAKGELETFFNHPFSLNAEVLHTAARYRTLALSSINASLKASQL